VKICFYALNAYPTLAGTPEARVGGAEVQQVLIASYLVEQGHEVTFVVRDHGQQDGEVIRGIKVLKAYKPSAGLPVVRFIHPRFTGSWSALKAADADIYYQRCASMETGLLALFCKMNNKPFIFASGSDSDFEFSKIMASSIRDKYLYTYGLKRANLIITQTNNQRKLLNDNFSLDAEVISNSWGKDNAVQEVSDTNGYVLWVSTLRGLKRPELFMDLAEALPDVEFVMVGGSANGEQAVYDNAEARAKQLPNMHFVGFVPFDEVDKFFNGAKIVVNTSIFEGFPNTFLQAWQRSIPVVSYFDPDDLVKRKQIGIAVTEKEEMSDAIHKLVTNNDLYASYQHRAKEYFENNHRVDVIGARYEKLFEGLIKKYE